MTVMWAQPLDTNVNDYALVELNGKMLSETDKDERRQVNRLMDDASASGKQMFSKDHVVLTVNNKVFSLKVPCVEKDIGDRIAPIVYIDKVSTGAAVTAPVKLTAFATRIGRTLSKETLDLVREAFLGRKR